MIDTRTKNERTADLFVSNTIDTDHFTTYELLGLWGQKSLKKPLLFSADGYVYDSCGKRTRKWYIDLSAVRGPLSIGPLNRLNSRTKQDWKWFPDLINSKKLLRQLIATEKKCDLLNTQLWTWIQRLYSEKIILATVPDYNSELAEYKLNVLQINESYHEDMSMKWLDPDKATTGSDAPSLSYGFSSIDSRTLDKGAKVDLKGGKLFQKMQEKLHRSWRTVSQLKRLFSISLERTVLADIEQRRGKTYSVCRFECHGRVEQPHEIIDVTVDGQTFAHHIRYNDAYNCVSIILVESGTTRHYRIEV